MANTETVSFSREVIEEEVLPGLRFVEELMNGMYGFFTDNPDCADRAWNWFKEHDIPMNDLLAKIKETES